MNNYKQKPAAIWLAGMFLITASPVFASSVSGGALTLNIDSTALAAAFNNEFDPNRPSFYVEEYFDSEQAANRSNNQILNDHIVPGTGVIPSTTGMVFSVNGTNTIGSNKPNDFTFNASDFTGTASGSIGVGGAIRYRIDKSFTINEVTLEEEGNRAVNGYMTLEYNAARSGTQHSGWTVFNHYSFRADVFDLDNVITTITGDSLTLTGDLALASGFNHMGGIEGAIVGDFSFQTTVVPIPAAAWFFASGLAGLFVNQRKQKALAE